MQFLCLQAVVAFAVVLPLAVSPSAKARFREHALLDFPLLSQRHLRLELIDLPSHVGGNSAFKCLFPACSTHEYDPIE